MLIIDMEMPNNCGECPFVTPYSRCLFLGMYAIDEDKRVENCPIKGELVRCKDCKHWDEESTFCLNMETCYGVETTKNWFCAGGQKMDGEVKHE